MTDQGTDESHPIVDVPRGASDPVAELDAAFQHTQRLASLGTIAALIAHEFNNLLTPVMSYAQMALDDPADAALTRKALEKSLLGSQRAAEIASAILAFARADFAELPKQPAEEMTAAQTDVLEAVDAVMNCLAREPAKDGIKVVVDVPRGTIVPMRPVALQQVLLNLVLNARRAMEGGGGCLTIRAKVGGELPSGVVWSDEERGRAICSTWNNETKGGAVQSPQWVVFEVQDTGYGVMPALVRAMFASYVSRADNASGAKSGVKKRGTGLGLTVCARLVSEVGGAMWAVSELGVGTRVGFVVPRR